MKRFRWFYLNVYCDLDRWLVANRGECLSCGELPLVFRVGRLTVMTHLCLV